MVALFGGVVVTAEVGENAELALEDGGFGGVWLEPGEGLAAQASGAAVLSPGLQLEHGCLGRLNGLVEIAGGVVVVAGFQQLLDILLAGLREGADAPVPERRRPDMCSGGGVRIKVGEGAGGPPVHEMQRRRILAGHWDEEPGGAGRSHRGRQAVGRVNGRPEFLSQVGLVPGVLVVGEPRVFEADLAATGVFHGFFDGLAHQVEAGGALRVGGPFGLLA